MNTTMSSLIEAVPIVPEKATFTGPNHPTKPPSTASVKFNCQP